MNPKNEDRKLEIYNFICDFVDEFDVAPTFAEISNQFNISLSTAHKYVQRLVDEGALVRLSKEHMVISGKENNQMEKFSYDNEKEYVNIPIIGEIACGLPLQAQEDINGYIPVGRDAIGEGNYFALIAKGESMIDAGINPGDLVIIRQQEYADDGQIVVAAVVDELTNEYDATLKRIYVDRVNKKIFLRPENKLYDDIIVDDVKILGIAKLVIKKL